MLSIASVVEMFLASLGGKSFNDYKYTHSGSFLLFVPCPR